MQKKLACLFLCISLTLSGLPGPHAALADGPADGIVRVRISVGAPASVSFFVDGNYGVSGTGGPALERQLYTVKLEGGTLKLYYGDTPLCSGPSLRLEQHAATPGRNNFIWMKWDNGISSGYAGYPGDMEFIQNSGSIMAVSHVYIEDYLCGVVPYEMSNSWPVEALKAQAVAARNYVYANMGGSGAYDVVDTTADQVYRGYNAANTNAIQAVEQTANKVLTCGGQLVEIFYSASNGGWTEIPQHVWSASNPLQPYQVIREDTFDTQNPSSLQEAYIFPKLITDQNPVTYTQNSGSANTGSEIGNAENYLKAQALSAVAAKGYVASSIGDIQIVGVNGINPNTYADQHDINDSTKSNPCPYFEKADINMTVEAKRASDGGQEQTTVDFSIELEKLFPDPHAAAQDALDSLRLITVESSDSAFTIYHRRYGHGVGFSQRGAQERAKSSDPAVNTYDKILGFYYPNTDFTALPYARPALTALTPPDNSNAAIACTGSVNVRSSPDSSSGGNLLGTLPNGARIAVAEQNAATGWHRIVYGGRSAYISSSYVQMDPGGGTPPSPTPAPEPTPTPTPAQPPAQAKPGDVNGDGTISIGDYTLVRLAILGIRPLAGSEQAAADVNRDGAVSIADYTLIRLDILGIRKIE